jgi:hypothetical protein
MAGPRQLEGARQADDTAPDDGDPGAQAAVAVPVGQVAGLGSDRSSCGAAWTSRIWYFSTAWRTTSRSR